jgi:hypothetical protein
VLPLIGLEVQGAKFMLEKIWITNWKSSLLTTFLAATLASCNFPGLSTDIPTLIVPEEPTSLPTETQPPMTVPIPTSTENVIDPIVTATSTPPPELPGQCRPFPDQVYPDLKEGWVSATMWVKCGSSAEPITVGSPVNGLYWDYSNQTGKIVYGQEYTPGPDDLDVWIGDYSLWVYDFRTGMNTQWIKGGVLEAKWEPEVEGSGIQKLAVLLGDGTVAMVTGPEQIEALVNIDRYDLEMDACCISWSPEADKLAYVKNETLYVVPTTPQEPRMLAENAFGPPAWVFDQQYLIFPSSVIKIAQADGSGPFIPNIPDGNRIWAAPESTILWDPASRTLVFDEVHIIPTYQAITWVHTFSEDFETVIELYSFVREDGSYLQSWYDQGKSFITSKGDVISTSTSESQISLEGVIDRIYQGRYMFWLEGDPYPVISISMLAQIKDPEGNRASILDLDTGMKLKITGKDISHGRGFLVEEIQILSDE